MFVLILFLLALIWFRFGRGEDRTPSSPPAKPRPVTVTGVRIPANGTRPHLLSLITTSDCGLRGHFLFHIPNLRQYWNSANGWRFHDVQRLRLQQDHRVERSHSLRLQHDLQKILRLGLPQNDEQLLLLRQRYYIEEQYHVVQQKYYSCIGEYYIFYSFDTDGLPENLSVPDWVNDVGGNTHRCYFGDVFLVKMAPGKDGKNGWATYEDIVPQFLDLLAEGPLESG